MRSFILLCVLFFATSCTLTLTNVHTEGQASDVVDETETTTPDVRPNIQIPLSPFKT